MRPTSIAPKRLGLACHEIGPKRRNNSGTGLVAETVRGEALLRQCFFDGDQRILRGTA